MLRSEWLGKLMLVVFLAPVGVLSGEATGDRVTGLHADPAGVPGKADVRDTLAKWHLGPRSQGKRNTCSVFTAAGALEFAVSKCYQRGMPLSVEYLNWACNEVIHNRTDDRGQFFHDLLTGFDRYGVCPDADMPYGARFDPELTPSAEARLHAGDIRALGLRVHWINPWTPQQGLTDEHLRAIQSVLADGYPVAAGSGHSRLLVGYEADGGKPGGGVFFAKDSGVGAYTELSYQWVKDNVADVFWVEAPARLRLWYSTPAERWTDALPVGNGRLGAMVFGGTTAERIQLNEDSVWAGPPVPPPSPGFADAMRQARELWFAGKYADADRLVQQHMAPRISPRSHQTLGDLYLDMPTAEGDVEGYRRELDLDAAVATTRFAVDGVTYTRTVYCSRPDQVIVVRLTADRPGSISVRARLSRPEAFTVEVRGDNSLVMYGQAQHDGKQLGAKWHAELRAVASGGSVASADNELAVNNADGLTLLIAAVTDFNRPDPYAPLTGSLADRCTATLDAAAGKNPEEFLAAATAAHREQFRRCALDLGGHDKASLPTNQRLDAVKAGGSDPDLLALLFQYGRYLLIGSSQPGTMPANLQGLWNDQIAAPWNADYHININLQMNYWPAQVTNLADCQEPYFAFLEALLPHAQQSARENYGCRGAVAEHTTDAWLHANPFGNVGYGMFPHGFGWCTRMFMDAYRFSGDQKFLEEHAYPILKEAALFYLDYLVADPETGKLVSGLDNSPENAYRAPDGTVARLSMGPSMSQEIVWDVFHNLLDAAAQLNIDDGFIRDVADAMANLQLPGIGADGRLMEWALPFEEPEPGHRHMSHLYGLHPGTQFNLYNSPDTVDAARKSIEYRLAHGGGHTGWSRAWIINFFARLHDGENAHANLEALARQSLHTNLFDNHPPFQIDGNFGATAGIAEMLLQSHVQFDPPEGPYLIELLPALPSAWPEGKVRGLRARGGVEIDLAWRNGTLTHATLRADHDGPCILAYRGNRTHFDLRGGESREVDPKQFLSEP